MKKIYLCLIGFLATGTIMAQKSPVVVDGKKNPLINEKAPSGSFNQLKGVTVWENDFSDATQWVITTDANGTPPHTAGEWTITTDVNAAPVTALQPAGHTSAANGYAIIDSDAAGGTASQNSSIYCLDTIDLSAETSVVMVFEQTTRRYAESTYVIFSTDLGATWQEVEVNAGMTVNTNSPNPEIIQQDLTQYLAGQSQVMVGFKYTGQWDWFWAVDDVKLMSADDYDLTVTGAYWGTDGAWGARLPYYQVPVAQIAEVNFAGIVKNIGAQDQADVVFTAEIAGAYTGTSAATLVAAGATDTLDAVPSLTPPAVVADHQVDLSVSSSATDAAPENNLIANAATISVNNDIYARDKGTLLGGSYNAGNAFEVGNIFDMFASAELTAIDVHIHPAAVAGAEMYVKLYSIDTTTGDFVFVDESALYSIQAADLDALISLPLSSPQMLNAGESYLIVAGSYGNGGADNDLVVGTAGVSEAQTSFYLDGTDATWYYTTSTTMVRMNFGGASLNENNSLNVAVYPNPANSIINVASSLTEGTIVMTDVSGKTVKNIAIEGLTNTVNTADLKAGVYYVTVSNGTYTSTEKIVIKK